MKPVVPTPLDDTVLRRSVLSAGGFLLALGSAVVIGKQAEFDVLALGGFRMAWATAAAFGLSGVALIGLALGRRWLATVAAAMVFALGLGTAGLYAGAEIFGWPWFRPVTPGVGPGLPGVLPNRMAPNAAVAFALLATALLALARGKWWPHAITVAAAAVIMLGGMALVGLITNLQETFVWWRYAGMALPTAIGFLLAGGVLMFWVIRRAPAAERAQAGTFPFFAMAGALSVVLGLIVAVSEEERAGAVAATRHGMALKAGVERFIAAMARTDTAARNFALTGDERFAARVAVHRAAVAAALDELEELAALHPAQLARARALRPAAERNFALKDREIEARRTGGAEAAVAAFRAEPPEMMAALRAATDAMLAEADLFLGARDAETRDYERKLRWSLAIGVTGALAMLLTAFLLLARAQARLRAANDRLEERVAERTRALHLATDEMQLAEERFRSALVNSPVPAMLWTDAGQILLLNTAWLERSGYTAAELPTIRDWTRRALGGEPPVDLPRFLAERFAHVARMHDGERAVRTKSGERQRWDFHTACIGQLPGGGRLLVSKAVDVTEQHAAAAQLQESEQRYRRLAAELEQRVAERTAELSGAQATLAATNRLQRAVLDGPSFAIIATRRDGVIEIFSRGAEQMLGYAAEELVGRATPEAFHVKEEVKARAGELSARLGAPVPVGFEAFVALARRGETDEREWTYLRKDGTRVPVRLGVTALRDEAGEITGFLGVAQDLTLRRQAEIALQASEKRLEEVLGKAACLVWEARVQVKGADWDWHLAIQPSGLSARLFDGNPNSAGAGLWYRFDVPEQNEMNARCRDALLAGRAGYEQEFRVRRDGVTTWIHEAVSISRPGPGDFWLVGVATDVTERRRAVEALRESQEIMRLFATHAPASVAMFDRTMRYLVVSREWMAAYGLKGEVIGRSHYEVFPEIGRDWKDLHARCLAGAVESCEADLFVRADGRRQWLRWEVRPWHDASGAIGGIVMFTADITERKRLEESLAEARDAALEASRLKSEFLATVSHEIRTPMNAIVGMSELLADSPLTADQRHMTRTIQGGAESLLAIINDILDFSRIEAGRLRLDPEPFELRVLLEETVALLALRAGQKRIELACEIDPEADGVIVGDAGRVRQVVTNLLGNAIKFTEHGSVGMVARVLAAAPGALRFRVTVRDTGMGIPRESQARIFQPFMQADGSTTRHFGGTGLGLAISRQIVEAMGGQIGFESQPGRGSVFWFELEVPRGTALPHRPAPPASMVAGSAARILLVEDNPANQWVADGLLRKLGHAVEIAGNGERALELLARERFAAVLMDCQMPGMDGYKTTQRIRSGTVSGVDPRIPVIALTANAMGGDRAKCLAAGMDDHLAKPVRLEELRAVLSRHGVGYAEVPTTAALPATTDDERGVFDAATLGQLRDLPGAHPGAVLSQVVRIYRAETPAVLERIADALEAKQADEAADVAHGLAGTAAVFGAREVRQEALALERAVKNGDWPRAVSCLAQLRAADKRLCAEVSRRGLS